jgi:putative mRNA 3-end processing factor
MSTIDATGAECVWVTHGYREPVARYLEERGLRTRTIASQWEGEGEADDDVGAVAGEETTT